MCNQYSTAFLRDEKGKLFERSHGDQSLVSCRNIYAEHGSEEADRRVLPADPHQFFDLLALFLVEGGVEKIVIVVAGVSAGYEICVLVRFFQYSDSVQCVLRCIEIERTWIELLNVLLGKLLFFNGHRLFSPLSLRWPNLS